MVLVEPIYCYLKNHCNGTSRTYILLLVEVGTGKKIPPGRVFGNDPLWAVRFGYCRDGYKKQKTLFFVSCYVASRRGVPTDSHVCRRDFPPT